MNGVERSEPQRLKVARARHERIVQTDSRESIDDSPRVAFNDGIFGAPRRPHYLDSPNNAAGAPRSVAQKTLERPGFKLVEHELQKR